ncbi:MAG: hypothetical protein WAQ83_18040, partial [Saprospiraceae bacterium]
DETIINNIFDRINKNVAKLTSQELRHAKYSGVFITSCEELTDFMLTTFPDYFPQIAKRSLSQMKDVEFVSQILLRIESEPRGYSTDELDEEFGARDDDWQFKETVTERFKKAINHIKKILELDQTDTILRSRFKNQADFYTLIGTFDTLTEEGSMPNDTTLNDRLITFINYEVADESPIEIKNYYEYVRAASNRTLARKERESILRKILKGEIVL